MLADVARWRAAQGRPIHGGLTEIITPDDLLQTLAAQGSVVETGDILLVRTGWLPFYRTLDPADRGTYAASPLFVGLEASEAMAACLWDLHVSCLGCDNPAVESWPPPMYAMSDEERTAQLADSADPAVAAGLFLHLVLLPLLGLPLGELFDLESLADECDRTRNYDFMVTSAPLNLLHGVATPPNILAIC